MAKPLSRVRLILLLFLLGSTAGADRSDTCPLGPYGVPLPDAPEECSLHRAPRSSSTGPAKERAADPPAKESSRPWIRLGAWAQEVTRSPSQPPEAGILLMGGEPCHQWEDGQVSPVETFHCPTKENQEEEMFCCGTCTASYCCSSLTERLDQESCSKSRSADQAPEDVQPAVRRFNTFSLLEFVIIAVGISTSFIIFFCVLRYLIESVESRNAQRVENAQLDLVREIPTVSGAAESPPPERAASATPSSLAGDSPRASQLSLAVPAPALSWSPVNRIREMIGPAMFFLGGPLGFVPAAGKKKEEEKKEEAKEEEEEETTL